MPGKKISRKQFITRAGYLGGYSILLGGCNLMNGTTEKSAAGTVFIPDPLPNEDIFSHIQRIKRKMNMDYYRKIVGAANEFREGDQIAGIAADGDVSRQHARTLLANTKIAAINQQPLFTDELVELINSTTEENSLIEGWTFADLKDYILTQSEENIKKIMPALTSDVIACLVKMMSNEELVAVGRKVFNPLQDSNIGSKGYLGARIQPNSPTDDTEDIIWQVFDGWSYAVGDLVLGTNPVSSEPASVAKIEQALHEILVVFNLQSILPNCVLSHIDIQAKVEEIQPGTTGIWFQSIAGTVNANQTFDLSIEKMFRHTATRTGQYGLYAETGQGADGTNGHGEGFDMVVHEARKYGFVRALKMKMTADKSATHAPWVFLNDVAGFIGPEVFRTKEQLVRCCLEDTIMGKLHGLTIGLDICTTLHMDVTLDDLNWCMDRIMPANPAYLMALPTKNDPMLSYLTTSFSDHLRIRHQFGYKVNDRMWDFFKRIGVINQAGTPTSHFGDPVWVYYQYCMAKGDERSYEIIAAEGKTILQRIRKRGVPIAEGYGKNYWEMQPALDKEVHVLYEDAKKSLWTETPPSLVRSIKGSVALATTAENRKDYVYHPVRGEKINQSAAKQLQQIQRKWGEEVPDLQIIISDGLNVLSLTDPGHLDSLLPLLELGLANAKFKPAAEKLVITHGRVRAGYQCGEFLFGNSQPASPQKKYGILHIIGERPGSSHHSFSVYITFATKEVWQKKGQVDHNITRVVSGISDTSLLPVRAVKEIIQICREMSAQGLQG